jgi:hypothetical protein
MTTNTEPDFDPRFDPAFQRGFASDGAPQSPAPRRGDQRQNRPAQPSPPPVPDSPVSSPATTSLSSAPLTSSPVSGVADAAADPEPDSRPNPFLIALGVLSVALVAAGIWGVQTARAPFLGTNVATDVDFVGLQILQVLAPMAIALGAATAIGILFVYAVGWQRRRAR